MDGIGLLLAFACAGAGIYFWWSMRRQDRADGASLPEGDLDLASVGPGGVLHLRAIGPDLEDFDVSVLGRHRYRDDDSEWWELECDRGGSTVWIDMEEDDGWQLSIGLRRVKLRHLGMDMDRLEDMADEGDGSFIWEGETYYFEGAGRAQFARNGQTHKAENLRFWDFETDDGEQYIGIEQWEDGSVDVTCSQPIDAAQISIYRASGDAADERD